MNLDLPAYCVSNNNKFNIGSNLKAAAGLVPASERRAQLPFTSFSINSKILSIQISSL